MSTSDLSGGVDLRVAQHVKCGIAELDVDGGYSLEVVTDVELVAHAHAAVQLHRLVGDKPGRVADLRFGAGGEPRSARLVRGEAEVEMLHQGDRFLMRNEHVDHPMLKHLEGAERRAELFSCL